MFDGITTKILSDQGLFIGGIIIAAVAYLLGWWVSGREFRAVTRDRDFWRNLALKNANIAENVTNDRSAAVTALESVARHAAKKVGDGP